MGDSWQFRLKGGPFPGGAEIKESHLSDEGKAMLKTKNMVKLGICVCNVLQIEWTADINIGGL